MTKTANRVSVDILLKAIYESALEKKAGDVVMLDLRGLHGSVSDFFVICSGTSSMHVSTIAQYIESNVQALTGEKVWQKEGFENSEWVLLDYVNVVVHVFQPQARVFYKLEDLWADGKIYNI